MLAAIQEKFEVKYFIFFDERIAIELFQPCLHILFSHLNDTFVPIFVPIFRNNGDLLWRHGFLLSVVVHGPWYQVLRDRTGG